MIGLFLNKYTIGLAAVVIITACIYGKGLIDGKASCEAKIERQNNDAVSKARDARRRIDECFNSGGMWNDTSSKCER